MKPTRQRITTDIGRYGRMLLSRVHGGGRGETFGGCVKTGRVELIYHHRVGWRINWWSLTHWSLAHLSWWSLIHWSLVEVLSIIEIVKVVRSPVILVGIPSPPESASVIVPASETSRTSPTASSEESAAVPPVTVPW